MITTEESNRRLTILKERLLNLSEEERMVFDMDLFFHDCGTAACALGLACTIPEFHDLGLGQCHGQPIFVSGESGAPTYKEYEAGAKFFGITLEESRSLFHPHAYPGNPNNIFPETVAAKITRLINNRKLTA